MMQQQVSDPSDPSLLYLNLLWNLLFLLLNKQNKARSTTKTIQSRLGQVLESLNPGWLLEGVLAGAQVACV